MSIFASWAAPDDREHEDDCAHWLKHDGYWEPSGKPCDCGQPHAPIIYQGSHVLPSDDDPRGGSVDIASIPEHIERDDRPELPEGTPKPWLRLGLYQHTASDGSDLHPGQATLILDRRGVQTMRDAFDAWLADHPTPGGTPAEDSDSAPALAEEEK